MRRKVKRLTVTQLQQKDLSRLNIDDEPGWYIEDPNGDERWVGPYTTKAEAMEDKKGLERFWKNESMRTS